MSGLSGKVLMVTGAASGIGRAAVARLAAEGGALFCVDLQAESVEEVAARAREAGGRALSYACDVSDEAQVAACVASCITSFGRLDGLCNMAGIIRFGNLESFSYADFQRIVNVNLGGVFLMCRAALPELLKSRGVILNASSTAALAGLPWGAAYAASKGGVLALTQSIAVQYAKQGVRANCIAPGDILTPLAAGVEFPADADMALLGRISSLTGAKGPDAVAGLIAFLMSDDACHITGECVRVDGGTLA